MATKTHIAWSVAAISFVAAMGLGGALYRTHETGKKQIAIIDHLRAEQAKIGELSEKNSTRLANDVTRMERELSEAQNAQRALTDQLFALEEENDYLQYTLDSAEEEQAVEVVAPSPLADSPYPKYLALKRAVLAGEPYHAQWEALQQKSVSNDPANEVLNAHTSGVASLETLKQELREAYDSAHEVTQEDPILSRLGNVISIRKLDKENDAIREIVVSGDVDKAAESLRNDSAYADWIAAYDARREVLEALDDIEAQLEGQNG